MKRFFLIALTLALLLACSGALAATTATTKMPLATRTGPGTQYTEPGTFLTAGQQVIVHTKVWDEVNRIWWVQVEFTAGGRIYRVYTGANRLNVNLNNVPEERVLEYSYMMDFTYGYSGPGWGHAFYDKWYIVRETNCRIMEVEDDWCLIDTTSSWPAENVRVWVPIDMVAGGWKYYDVNTYDDRATSGGSSSATQGDSWCRIIASSAHVRSGPGTNYATVTYVKEGQWYEILDRRVGNTGKVWYYINVDGDYGWISSGITNKEQ